MDDLHLATFPVRSWSPAKSSMPVGVIEKDTVLFAVPKKGRTSCGET